MTEDLSRLSTEQVNPETKDIDALSARGIVGLINKQDARIHLAVERELDRIAEAVDIIAEALQSGGRLLYIGAGTSGRLGVLDASECPPTYGTAPELVVGIMAGGDVALRASVEGMEDNRDAGTEEALKHGVGGKDVLVGITASGRSPYVLGALEAAREAGCKTIGLCNTDNPKMAEFCDICIAVVTGPEAIMGSTRMKAGTAQKMVLNMLSTASMVKIGKVYKNLMVDVRASNKKLIDRAERIVALAAECDKEQAREALSRTNYRTKPAIVMLLTGCGPEEAEEKLRLSGGFVGPCAPA